MKGIKMNRNHKASMVHGAVALALSSVENITTAVNPEVVAGRALSSKNIGKAAAAAKEAAKQAMNFGEYGQGIAKAYLMQVGNATVTWQLGIVKLCKTANNVQQELAMKGCIEVAAAYGDEGAVVSLKKRVSESRRVFKALLADHKGTLAVMEGKGSWAAKVNSLPKGKTGRPTSTPEVTGTRAGGEAGAEQAATQGAAVIAELKKGSKKVQSVPVGVAVAAIKMQSPENLLICVDTIAFQLANLPEKTHLLMRDLGKQIQKARDIQDKAQVQGESKAAIAAHNAEQIAA